MVSVTDMFTVDIIDNGCGMPVDNLRRSGLANMHYRAEQLGGTLHASPARTLDSERSPRAVVGAVGFP
jgi:signal transduction histidine kinase